MSTYRVGNHQPQNALWPGRLVTIDAGRHRGKTGVFLGYDVIQSGQTQLYPRVALSGTQQEVRVRTVTPVCEEAS